MEGDNLAQHSFCLGVGGVEEKGLSESGGGLVPTGLTGECDAEVEMGPGVSGLKPRHLGELITGFVDPVERGVFDAEQVTGFHETWVEADSRFQTGEAFRASAKTGQCVRPMSVGDGEAGIQLERAIVLDEGTAEVAGLVEGLPQGNVCVGPVVLQAHHLLEERDGFRGATGTGEIGSGLVPPTEMVGKKFGEAAPLANRAVEIPGGVKEFGETAAKMVIVGSLVDGLDKLGSSGCGGIASFVSPLGGDETTELLEVGGVVDLLGEGRIGAATGHDLQGVLAIPGTQRESCFAEFRGRPGWLRIAGGGSGKLGGECFGEGTGQGVVAFRSQVDVFEEVLRSGNSVRRQGCEVGDMVPPSGSGFEGHRMGCLIETGIGPQRNRVEVSGPDEVLQGGGWVGAREF